MNKYYTHLSRVQNYACNCEQDIMTITGMMSKAEKIKHLARYAEIAQDIKALNYCKTN